MKNRVFISFAIEDKTLKDLLVGQARNERSPFEFVDMSVKQPWDSEWKTNCRRKIKGCDGVIVLITKQSKKADGQLWEVNCAKEENIPIIGVWGYRNDIPVFLPTELQNIRTVDWTWSNIEKWINLL